MQHKYPAVTNCLSPFVHFFPYLSFLKNDYFSVFIPAEYGMRFMMCGRKRTKLWWSNDRKRKAALAITVGAACKKMKKLAFKLSSISWQEKPHNGVFVRFNRCIIINASLG